MRLVEPASGDEAAAILAEAARSGQRVVVRGGGTKFEWTSAPPEADVLLSTARLNKIVAHRHGDLTATVEAGAVLDAVNIELGRHNQWIPLDPPWSERATIGGIVATNDSGPRRHRYGAPRDLIIGVEVARADGVRAKAGGIVVKNVAGYDLARLMTGSFGCLGIILGVTFKLYPRAAASRTVAVDVPSHAVAAAIATALDRDQLTPTAVEIQTPPPRILIRFESIEASVERQSATAARAAAEQGGRAVILRDEHEEREWRAHRARAWDGSGAVARVALLREELAPTLDAIADAGDGTGYDVTGRAGLGTLLLRIDGDSASQARVIATLRARWPPGRGTVVLVRASDELKAAAGVWGPMGDAFPVMQSVKRAFDPKGTINPGRGPGGL